MRKRLTVFLSVLGALAAGPAFAAGSAPATLTVTATVPGSCTASTSPVAFGSYTGVQLDASGNIAVNCSLDLPYSIELDGGGGVTAREMSKLGDATKKLSYELYSASDYSQVWGGSAYTTSGAAALGSLMGSGANQDHAVYGRIPAAAGNSPGDYEDSVAVTVLY